MPGCFGPSGKCEMKVRYHRLDVPSRDERIARELSRLALVLSLPNFLGIQSHGNGSLVLVKAISEYTHSTGYETCMPQLYVATMYSNASV